MSKTITINDEAYSMLRELAKYYGRTLSGQFWYILKNYSEPTVEAQPMILPRLDIDEESRKFEEVKRRKQEHPRLQAIKAEIAEIGEQLDNENSPTKANELITRLQELQKEANAISDELNK